MSEKVSKLYSKWLLGILELYLNHLEYFLSISRLFQSRFSPFFMSNFVLKDQKTPVFVRFFHFSGSYFQLFKLSKHPRAILDHFQVLANHFQVILDHFKAKNDLVFTRKRPFFTFFMSNFDFKDIAIHPKDLQHRSDTFQACANALARPSRHSESDFLGQKHLKTDSFSLF